MPVTVKGADRLAAGMGQAADELARMTDTHRQVARLVAQACRPPRRTGKLAGSIRPDGGADGALVEATAPYAAAVEGGVPSRGMKAQPFLRNAVRSTQSTWLELYARGAQDVLDDVKGA